MSGPSLTTEPAEPTETPGPVDPAEEAPISERPVEVIVPPGLDPDVPAPLVVVLHGYSGTGAAQDAYFGFRDEAADRGFVLVHPDGTTDQRGVQFWNAADACCNFFGAPVDDVAYLAAVVAHADAIHPVDPDRVFLAGHSNGGFMSYRLACERPDLFAAIVSLAGTMDVDMSGCRPDRPVSVVQVHGTLDDVIRLEGGEFLGGSYASATATIEAWTAINGCTGAGIDGAGATVTGTPLDLDVSIDGAETNVLLAPGCPADGAVELWTIEGGSHLPDLGPTFASAVFDFFDDHPRT